MLECKRKKKKTFLNFLFHLALAPGFLLHIPCLPSFSSLSSPALPYFYHSTIHSDPLLSSSFIPLFYMHPLLLLLLTSPLLPSVLYLLLSYYFYPDPFFSLSSPVLSFSPLGGRFGPVLKKLSRNFKKNKKSGRSDPPSAVLKTSTVTLHFHVCCGRLDSCQSSCCNTLCVCLVIRATTNDYFHHRYAQGVETNGVPASRGKQKMSSV